MDEWGDIDNAGPSAKQGGSFARNSGGFKKSSKADEEDDAFDKFLDDIEEKDESKKPAKKEPE